MDDLKNWVNLTEDGEVQKAIFKEGTGEQPPQGNEVEVHYEGRLASNGSIFDSSKTRSATFKFNLGEGRVIKGWEIGVAAMKKGEVAELKISPGYGYGSQAMGDKIPADSTLIFEIELIDFYPKIKSKYEMDLPEKLSNAKKLKDEGVTLFQQKNFADAASKFEEGYSFLEKTSQVELTQEAKDLMVSLLLNMSNCYNNTKQWSTTIKKASEALNLKDNPKGYYYRGMAYANEEDFLSAEKDYQKLCELVPKDDPGVTNLKKTIDDKQKDKAHKEKSLFKSFFKSPVYEDKPLAEHAQNVPEKVNPDNYKVFFDIKIGEQEPKRVEFELFKDKVPKTAENFRQLCIGFEDSKQLHFKDSIFHRIIKGFMMQGGDFENANGTGGCSIYGRKFDDENFYYKHSQGGLLSMANSGPNTNGSQFFITFKETSWLDKKHVVFGKVISGMDVVKEVEEVTTNDQDKPSVEIKIVDCGELKKE